MAFEQDTQKPHGSVSINAGWLLRALLTAASGVSIAVIREEENSALAFGQRLQIVQGYLEAHGIAWEGEPEKEQA